MQYLTKCIPATIVKGVKARDFYYRGLTEDKADLAGENLSNLIAYQTKQGWSLHSIEEITVRVKRKRFLKVSCKLQNHLRNEKLVIIKYILL